MGCVNNVYDHQLYLIACVERVLPELRNYRLTKFERELLRKFMVDSYKICKKYRDRAAATRQKRIAKLVAEMKTPRVYYSEDDLPF